VLRVLVCAVIGLSLWGCNESDSASPAEAEVKQMQLSGEVYYLEKKLLPPGAELQVTLEDVSKMDVASTALSEQKQTIEGAPPYAFSLNYDPNAIQPKMAYSLRAKVMMADKLLMTSTEAFDPFKSADDAIKIKLSMVGHGKKSATLTTPDTGLAVVSVNPLATLTNTYWKLLSIGGEEVVMAENQAREAYVQMNDNDKSVKGFAGCNQIMGTFEASGNRIKFGPIAATRKACMSGMETESAFVKVLEDAGYFSIHEHNMTLLNGEKKPIARFQAQYF
jgi:putative lipoprotein